jgi:hypothetical protein
VTTAGEPRRGSRALERAAHHAFPWLFAALVALGAATALTGNHIQVLRYTAGAAGVLWAFTYPQLTDYHDRHLCERCASEVPLDAQEQASRRRRTLRWHHRALPSMAVIGVIVAALLLSHLLPRPLSWGHYVIDVAGIAAAAWFYQVERLHRRLQPWCPWCPRWGGGGDGEHEPSPEPDPAVSL